MNSFQKARATTYATGIVAGLVGLLSSLGLADYDAVAQTIDPHPIPIYILVMLATPVVGSTLALVALVRGWGSKKS